MLMWHCFRFHALYKSHVKLHPRVPPENPGNNGTGREDEALGAEDRSEEAAAASSCTILQQQ